MDSTLPPQMFGLLADKWLNWPSKTGSVMHILNALEKKCIVKVSADV